MCAGLAVTYREFSASRLGLDAVRMTKFMQDSEKYLEYTVEPASVAL